MPSSKTLGIAIRIADFSESSQVATFLTRDFGKVPLIAKGSKRPKNNFDGPLDLFRHASLVFIPKRPGTLGILTESRMRDSFLGIARAIQRYYAACYASELAGSLLPEYQESEPSYTLLLEFLRGLAQGNNIAVSLALFEIQFLRALGYMPWRKECPNCERPLKKDERVSFSVKLGGGLCQSCSSNDPLAMPALASTIALGHSLGSFHHLNPGRLRIPDDALRRLRELTAQLVRSILGREPRTLAFTMSRGVD